MARIAVAGAHGTLAFYEPLLSFDLGYDTSHGDTGDARAGFSYHL